jgi:hypothetical protein
MIKENFLGTEYAKSLRTKFAAAAHLRAGRDGNSKTNNYQSRRTELGTNVHFYKKEHIREIPLHMKNIQY